MYCDNFFSTQFVTMYTAKHLHKYHAGFVPICATTIFSLMMPAADQTLKYPRQPYSQLLKMKLHSCFDVNIYRSPAPMVFSFFFVPRFIHLLEYGRPVA